MLPALRSRPPVSRRNDSIGPRLRKRERVACREGCLERLVQHFLPVQFFFICGPIRDLRAASLLLSIIHLLHELLPHSLPLYWMPQGMRIVRFSWQINARAISCRLSGEYLSGSFRRSGRLFRFQWLRGRRRLQHRSRMSARLFGYVNESQEKQSTRRFRG